MDIKSFIKKANQIEIKVRSAINSKMHGNFNSIFKGSGLEFKDLRQYQYGDDIRHIDWNTSAKGHGTFIKLYAEEKEQSIHFLIDSSASQSIGGMQQNKLDTAKEIAAVLTISAIQEGSNIGLCFYSDKKELLIPPQGGNKNLFKILKEIATFEPGNHPTNLNDGLKYLLNLVKKKSLIILISDFLDENFEDILIATKKKHDLILIQILDKKESKFPNIGLIPIMDVERNELQWVNTNSKKFKNWLKEEIELKKVKLQNLCKKLEINYLEIENGEDIIKPLIQLFNTRNKYGPRN